MDNSKFIQTIHCMTKMKKKLELDKKNGKYLFKVTWKKIIIINFIRFNYYFLFHFSLSPLQNQTKLYACVYKFIFSCHYSKFYINSKFPSLFFFFVFLCCCSSLLLYYLLHEHVNVDSYLALIHLRNCILDYRLFSLKKN